MGTSVSPWCPVQIPFDFETELFKGRAVVYIKVRRCNLKPGVYTCPSSSSS